MKCTDSTFYFFVTRGSCGCKENVCNEHHEGVAADERHFWFVQGDFGHHAKGRLLLSRLLPPVCKSQLHGSKEKSRINRSRLLVSILNIIRISIGHSHKKLKRKREIKEKSKFLPSCSKKLKNSEKFKN